MTDFPQPFLEEMKTLLGGTYPRFEEAMAQSPSVSVRANRRKPCAVFPDEGRPVEWCPAGRVLSDRPVFTLDPLFHGGAFYVQESSSMIYSRIISYIVERMDKCGTLKVLDTCAAPGGKTTAIIDEVPDGTVVVANEFVAQRASVLAENIAKWGYPDAIVTSASVDAFRGMEFDIVTVDAPCSGEGMMRKEPEAVAQWSHRLISRCAALQREILDAAADALAPGGFLVYSTCTFNRSEDEENAEYIRDTLGLEPVEIPVNTEWGILGGIGTDVPCMRFIPGFVNGEGLFAAVFRKPVSDCGEAGRTVGKGNGRKGVAFNDKTLSEWVDGSMIYTERDGKVTAMSESTVSVSESLPKGVRVLLSGIYVAERKGKDWAPDTRLALSTAFNRNAFPIVGLERREALRYLKGEALILPGGTPRGYVAVCYSGVPLGFVKNIGNRANNLYPVQWRIRMQLPE